MKINKVLEICLLESILKGNLSILALNAPKPSFGNFMDLKLLLPPKRHVYKSILNTSTGNLTGNPP